MLTVKGNILKLTKGNSGIIDITPIDEETKEPYILQDGDTVLFTVKNGISGSMFQKSLTNSDYDEEDTSLNCAINPEDTIAMPVGVYDYDCLLLTADGQAVTFISSKFILCDAVGVYTDVGGGDNG